MIFNITLLIYVIFPIFAGYAGWLIKKHQITLDIAAPIFTTAVFWAIALKYGCDAFRLGAGLGKNQFALSTAALTVALTIYGEIFKSDPDDNSDLKERTAKFKSRITIFRTLLIFIFAVVFFKT